MSHATLLAILDHPDSLDAVMAPYVEECPDPDNPPPYFRLEEEDGEAWLTNPNAKWDWYLVGGRWAGSLIPTSSGAETITGRPGLMTDEALPGHVDGARKRDLDLDACFAEEVFPTLAVVCAEGWVERGKLGWFGVVRDGREEAEWVESFRKIIELVHPDMWLVIVDYHI